MQTPKRKLGKYANIEPDLNITIHKFNQLTDEMSRLKKTAKPNAIKETARLAEMGDFSENFAYQHAKRQLRGINNRIDAIDYILKRAKIIKPNKNAIQIELGHFVVLEINGKQKTYQILGSQESNPSDGTISHNSPIGSAVIDKKVGDIVEVKINGKIIKCTILEIK